MYFRLSKVSCIISLQCKKLSQLFNAYNLLFNTVIKLYLYVLAAFIVLPLIYAHYIYLQKKKKE